LRTGFAAGRNPGWLAGGDYVTNLIKTVDVSSAQTPSLQALNYWIAQGCQLLWVHSYHRFERRGLATTTRSWITVAKEAGVWCLPYCWLFRENDASISVADSIEVFRSVQEHPQIIALDCENYGTPVTDRGPTAEQILKASEQARALGVEPVLYSGKWWLDTMDGNRELLRGMPAWLANFNKNPVLSTPHPDWVEVIGHQYSADGLDWSIFDLDALTRLAEMHPRI